VEISNSSINPSSIVNILTLRYDPSINPNLPKKTWKDFEPIDEPPTPLPLRIQYVMKLKKN